MHNVDRAAGLFAYTQHGATLALHSRHAIASKDDFFRSAQWSPDGSSILTHSERRAINIHPFNPANKEIPIYKSVSCASACLAALWYPFASAYSPENYCYVRSTRDSPVVLVDGFSGKIRATYPIIDHTERFIGPHSFAFTLDGQKLYCGHENAIEVFDIGRDGEQGMRFPTTPNRSSKDGQKGLLSAIALSPSLSNTLACGSYSRTLALYDTASGLSPVQMFPAAGGGVTQVKFHPTLPQLYATSRNSDTIVCYDIRHAATPLVQYHRPGNTSQRLQFDIDKDGASLLTGDNHGHIRLYDLVNSETPTVVYKAASDAIGSAQFHPSLSHILIAVGSRNFASDLDSELSSSDESQT